MASIIGNRTTEDSIGFYVDFANRRSFSPNLLNYSVWSTGSGDIPPSSVYGTSRYDSIGTTTAEDIRIIDVDPFGYTSSVVWSSTSTDEAYTSGDGGWNTGNFPVDPRKLYRFSVWTKRSVFGAGTTFSGEFYHGLIGLDTPTTGQSLPTINPGITQSNAYFYRVFNSNTTSQSNINPPYLGGLDVWTLVVGHVWPFNTATGSRYEAGAIVTSKTATVNSAVVGGFVRNITNISITGDLTSQLSAGTWFYFTYNVRSFDGLVITASSWSGLVLSSTWNSGTNVTTVTPDFTGFTPIVGRSIHAAPPNTNQTVSTYGLTEVTTYGHPDSGVYTRTEGRIGWLNNINTASTANYTDFRWNFNTAYGRARSSFFYSGDSTATQKFIYPRVDVVDGSEPSISDLLTGTEPVRDLSTKNNTIYPFGSSNFDTGERGLIFSGRERDVVGGTLSSTFSANSVSVWFSPTNTVLTSTPAQTLFQFGPIAGPTWLLYLGEVTGGVTNEIITLVGSVGPTLTYVTTADVSSFLANTWYNVAVNFNGTKYDIYLNGILLTTTAGINGNAPFIPSVNYVALGGRNVNVDGWGAFFNGKIGSVISHERSLTATEISSNFATQRRKYGL
jgi:hypothetical protein